MTKREQFAKIAREIFAQEDKTFLEKRNEYNEFLKIQTIFKKPKKEYYKTWWWAIEPKVKAFIKQVNLAEYKSWGDCVKEFEKYMWAFRDYWNYRVIKYTESSDYHRGEYIADSEYLRIVGAAEDGILKREFLKANREVLEKEELEKVLERLELNTDIKEIVEKKLDKMGKV